jgi:hypothetical protein
VSAPRSGPASGRLTARPGAASTVALVTDGAIRYRCTACGNLTRFDVTTTRRTRAFHHYSVGGELRVEEEEVLAEDVEDVTCRWCGHGRNVEVLPFGADPVSTPQ